jgi:hypothetical protein
VAKGLPFAFFCLQPRGLCELGQTSILTHVSAVLHCRPISSVLGQDMWTVLMNAGIFIHCLIAYQVNANVWCSLLLHITVPK